jgi:serine/threonine-protein kinase
MLGPARVEAIRQMLAKKSSPSPPAPATAQVEEEPIDLMKVRPGSSPPPGSGDNGAQEPVTQQARISREIGTPLVQEVRGSGDAGPSSASPPPERRDTGELTPPSAGQKSDAAFIDSNPTPREMIPDELDTPSDHGAGGADITTLDIAQRRRVARYQTHGLIGRSASALHFRARDPNVSRPVLLKVMDPDFVSDVRLRRDDWVSLFKREARIAGRVNHPALPVLFDAGRDGAVFFIAYSMIEGRTLNAILDSGELLSPDAIRDIVKRLATALDHLHARGVVHCDVRAANVIIAPGGDAHLVDFSLASMIEGPEHPLLAANVHTASPEYLAGYGYSPKADQFALGMLLYQMLVGTRPFHGIDDATLIHEIQKMEPRAPKSLDSRIGPDLSEVAMRLLEKDPAQRFESMAELLHRLGGRSSADADSLEASVDDRDPTPTPVVERDRAPQLPDRDGARVISSPDLDARESTMASDIVVIDDSMNPKLVEEILSSAGARVTVHTAIESAKEQMKQHTPRMVIVARSCVEDPREVRWFVEQLSPDIDLRFVSDAATRLLGPLMSAEEHVLALIAVYERVATLAPKTDIVDAPMVARAIARRLGAGAKAELIAPLAVAARDLASRLRLSPTSEEVLGVVPGELEPLFQSVDRVLTDPDHVDGSTAPLLAQIVAVVESYFAATRPRDGRKRVSPRRAVLDLREQAGRRVRSDVVEALVEHLREVISALDLGPTEAGASRILVAGHEVGGALVEALECDGFAIEEAEDGHVAWEKLRKEAYRAAIVDRALPGRDGLALLRLCRAHPNTEQVPFLILGSTTDLSLASEVARAGSAEILDPTVGVDEIRARVERLMGNR